MRQPPRLLTLTALATVLAAALFLGTFSIPRHGAAQQPQATITGAITLATPGDTLPAGIEVQLIILDDSQSLTSVSQQSDPAGEFTFEVDPDPRFNYIPFLLYEGVRYFSNPGSIQFDDSTSAATVAFQIYSTTSEAPDLAITSTTVVVVALERSTSTITLVREDVIDWPPPTVYVGGEDRVTLRIPVPDGTLDAGGVDPNDTEFAFEGGTVNTSIPIRPGLNSIVTQYTVGYDAGEDMYRLRITSPLPTDHIEARVPDRFVHNFEPADQDARRTADTEFDGEPLLVIERTSPATPGKSLLVTLNGLSGAEPPHLLTTTTGAVSGSLLALFVIAGLAVALARRRPATDPAASPDTTEPPA